jgi:hypothetical protein
MSRLCVIYKVISDEVTHDARPVMIMQKDRRMHAGAGEREGAPEQSRAALTYLYTPPDHPAPMA